MGEFSNLRPIMNLANSIVGVSILAMPYCFSQCGVVLGTLLLVVCTLFTSWTCKMLMRAAIMTRSHTYENLALGVYGSMGKYIMGTSVIGLNLGTCIAFFVIIGDLAPPIVAQAIPTGITLSPNILRAMVLIVAGVLIAFPLGLCRSIDSLSGISMCSLIFYALLTLQLFTMSFSHFFWASTSVTSTRVTSTRVTWWDNTGLFKCLPIFALAFACQTQLFVIYSALKDPSFRRISSVINGATISTATLYFLVALFGYISFNDDGIKGDILSNFNVDFFSQVSRFGFSLSVVVSFPLMIFPCRASINSLFFSSKALELHVQEPIPRKRFVAITAAIIGFTLIVAILIPSVETVLGFTGATMGSLIAFIFPSVVFLKVAGSKAEYSNRAKVCALVGLCLMILSTAVILQSEMERSDVTGSVHPLVGSRPPPKPPDKPEPAAIQPPQSPVTENNDIANNHQGNGHDSPVHQDIPNQDRDQDKQARLDEPNTQARPDQQGMHDQARPGVQDKENVKSDLHEGARVGGGDTGEDVARGVGGVVKEKESLHKQIKEDMSELQSRVHHLEVENKDLKERQQMMEHIQEDDILQQPEVRKEVVKVVGELGREGGEQQPVVGRAGGEGGEGRKREGLQNNDGLPAVDRKVAEEQGKGLEVARTEKPVAIDAHHDVPDKGKLTHLEAQGDGHRKVNVGPDAPQQVQVGQEELEARPGPIPVPEQEGRGGDILPHQPVQLRDVPNAKDTQEGVPVLKDLREQVPPPVVPMPTAQPEQAVKLNHTLGGDQVKGSKRDLKDMPQ